jgi:hydroxyacylglutathione hydrolase
MPRSVPLSERATWWPSVLWQTTTLELRRDGVRLLVDPGIAPWEVLDAAGDGAAHVLLTHADWDHVMGIGLLPGAQVHASGGSAERIRSGAAEESVRKESAAFCLPLEGLEGLRVHRVLEPGETRIGPWEATVYGAPGHTDDGIATWLPEEGLLIVGDYLGPMEIPFVYESAWDYRSTLSLLLDLIDRERPTHVVIGHGRPHDADAARRIGQEDMAYVEALIAHAEGGGEPDAAAAVPHPQRGGTDDASEHADNVRRACEAVAAASEA